MKSITKFLTLAIILIFVSACANKPVKYIDKGTNPYIPAPSYDVSLYTQKNLIINTYAHTASMLAVLQAEPTHISLTATMRDGTPLFTTVYNKQTITTRIDTAIQGMPAPSNILADLALAFWPLDVLQVYIPLGIEIEDHKNIRTVKRNGQLVTEVIYRGDNTLKIPTKITQNNLGYSIEIQ